MNQAKVKNTAGRTAAGIALGALLALIAPIALMVEVFWPMTVVLLPSIALVALYRWAGRTAALSAAVLMLCCAALYMGGTLVLLVLLVLLLPPMLLLRAQDRPFFQQMRIAIAAFGAGVLAAVAVLYLSFGGNMIERLLGQLPDMVRALPEEYIEPMLQYLSAALQRTITTDAFYELYDSMIGELIQFYQLQTPQRLFSGALLTALICTWLSNRMRARRGEAAPGSYVPLRGWALPASTTGGLILMLAASWVLTLIDVRGADTVYYTVYGIVTAAFGAQTLGSAARRLRATSLRPGTQHGLLIAIGLVGWLWLPDAMLVYGGASAILGSRGVLQQRARNRNDDGRTGGGE